MFSVEQQKYSDIICTRQTLLVYASKISNVSSAFILAVNNILINNQHEQWGFWTQLSLHNGFEVEEKMMYQNWSCNGEAPRFKQEQYLQPSETN